MGYNDLQKSKEKKMIAFDWSAILISHIGHLNDPPLYIVQFFMLMGGDREN